MSASRQYVEMRPIQVALAIDALAHLIAVAAMDTQEILRTRGHFLMLLTGTGEQDCRELLLKLQATAEAAGD